MGADAPFDELRADFTREPFGVACKRGDSPLHTGVPLSLGCRKNGSGKLRLGFCHCPLSRQNGSAIYVEYFPGDEGGVLRT